MFVVLTLLIRTFLLAGRDFFYQIYTYISVNNVDHFTFRFFFVNEYAKEIFIVFIMKAFIYEPLCRFLFYFYFKTLSIFVFFFLLLD